MDLKNIYNAINNLYNMDSTTWQEVLSVMYNYVDTIENAFKELETKFNINLPVEVKKYIRELMNNGQLAEYISYEVMQGLNLKVDNNKTELQKDYNSKLEQLHNRGLDNLGYKPDNINFIYKDGKIINITSNDGVVTLNYDNELITSIDELFQSRNITSKLNYDNGILSSVVVSNADNTTPVYTNDYIFSMDNILVRYANGILYLSLNGGRTFIKSLDIGNKVIDKIHVFNTGELLFCDETKAYYSNDWITYNETMLDFTPTPVDNFAYSATDTTRHIINGNEILVWGTYSIDTRTEYIGIRVMYTTDKGKTIKTAYKFNTPSTLKARHIHNVAYIKDKNTFLVMTGDEDRELYSHVLEGKYNSNSDSWTWDLIGSGTDYKWGNLQWYNNNIYYSWDIPQGGVRKCTYENLKNPLLHEQIMQTKNDTVGVLIYEKTGEMLVIQSVYGGNDIPRRLYYSTDRKNFVEVIGDLPPSYNYADSMYYSHYGVNIDGKILSSIWSRDIEPLPTWDKIPSVFIDEIIRKEYPDSFKGGI